MVAITVYTSVAGLRNQLLDSQETCNADFVAFVDRRWNSKCWRQAPAYDRFKSPQRNALVPKLAAHHFVASDYSLWIEPNVVLRTAAGKLLEWVDGYDIAVFAHLKRNCAYEEAVAIASQGAADNSVVAAQMAKYRAKGFPERAGLPSTRFVLRRHSPAVEAFNDLWWSEYSHYVAHDQLAFPYAAWRTGVKVNYVALVDGQHPAMAVLPRKGFMEVRSKALGGKAFPP